MHNKNKINFSYLGYYLKQNTSLLVFSILGKSLEIKKKKKPKKRNTNVYHFIILYSSVILSDLSILKLFHF